MKILKNIGIYYIVLTALSFVWSMLVVVYYFILYLPFFILGILFLIIYYLRNKKYDKKIGESKHFAEYEFKIYVILILMPFIVNMWLLWYVDRPYNQRIVLPKNYEGVVVVQYNQPDGQGEKWIGGFLGIGADRLIEVDSTGIAKTQFDFIDNGLPFLGGQNYYVDGLRIVYGNDINKEIVRGADGKYRDTYKNKNLEKPSIYFVGYKHYPLIIFVVAKEKNYYNYFLNEQEKEIMRDKYQEDPYKYYPPVENELKKEYEKYYKLNPNY